MLQQGGTGAHRRGGGGGIAQEEGGVRVRARVLGGGGAEVRGGGGGVREVRRHARAFAWGWGQLGQIVDLARADCGLGRGRD